MHLTRVLLLYIFRRDFTLTRWYYSVNPNRNTLYRIFGLGHGSGHVETEFLATRQDDEQINRKTRFLAETMTKALTRTPWEMEQADMTSLRVAGFSDAAILDINQVTGCYAFVNRLADGLGVELEATNTGSKEDISSPSHPQS